MTKPSVYHSQGYNCAEALIKSYNEEHNTDIPVSLGSAMGTGMTVGSLCGAVNAAAMIVGYIGYARELMSRVRGKFNSEICADLKRNKVSCAEIIDFSYEALKEVLDK